MPQRLAGEASRSEPLEERIGFPIDRDFLGAWSTAPENLLHDPDAPLPNI